MSSSLAQPRSECRENTTISRASEDNDLRKQVDAGLQRLVLIDTVLVLFRISRLRAVPLHNAVNAFIPLPLAGI
jgi:hypothetical protein